jgi:hypothetical protein
MLRAMNRFMPLPWWLLALFATLFWLPTAQGFAQSGFSANPQTNLGPINSSSPSPSNSPAYGIPPANPAFDPYNTTPPNSGLGGPPLGGYGSSGYGGSTVAPLGSPTPLGPPTYSPGPNSFGAPPSNVASGVNPSYPNGSLLGGLFSGNWFRGNSGSVGTFQGAGYATPNGPLIPYGGTTSSAAPYTAPSIYGGAPPASNQFGGGNLYGSGPMLSPPANNGFGNPNAFPPSAYPSGSPNSLFPSGLYGSAGALLPSSGLSDYRFFNGLRLRHSYISGGDGPSEVGMNQTDVSLGFAFNNFLFSNRPLYVVPSFSLYLFDGPETTGNSPADLPGNAYGGFLDFGWQTDPNQIIGGELGLRVGAFTDFETFNDDSIRFIGKGLGSFRLTPTSTLKAGIYYLDRESIKLLPAGGLLWQPSPFTRFDIFFPEPKFSRYWRTIGTQDVWWYLAGEYGGDSWTMTRANQIEERVDINQIGVTFGFEWGRSDLIRTGQRRGFIEAGVVFDREIQYEFSNDGRDLDEAFILRAGWGY